MKRKAVDNSRRGQVRIVDEATRRAWSMLWPDMQPNADAEPQSDLLPAPPPKRTQGEHR